MTLFLQVLQLRSRSYIDISLHDASSALPNSLPANMVTARVHLQELEYTNAIKVPGIGPQV
jgi:hypothetical protein